MSTNLDGYLVVRRRTERNKDREDEGQGGRRQGGRTGRKDREEKEQGGRTDRKDGEEEGQRGRRAERRKDREEEGQRNVEGKEQRQLKKRGIDSH